MKSSGWPESEIAVFAALQAMGPLTLKTTVYHSGVAISTAHTALASLAAKGITETMAVNDETLHYLNPDYLPQWYAQKGHEYESKKERASQYVQSAGFPDRIVLPKQRIYTGEEGIVKSFQRMLEACSQGDQILSVFRAAFGVRFPLQQRIDAKHIPHRVKKGIRLRQIAFEGPMSREYQQRDRDELRETKIVPHQLLEKFLRVIPHISHKPCNTEITLFGDSVHWMSFDEHNASAAIISDTYLVSTIRFSLEALWYALSSYQEMEHRFAASQS